MEKDAQLILGNELKQQKVRGGLGTEISSLFDGPGIDDEIPELHGYGIKAVSFDR